MIGVGLAGLLVVVPVALGGNRPLVWTALAVALGGLMVAAAVGGLAPHLGRLRWALGAWLAVVAWAIVQAVPWTPADWHHPAWTLAAGALPHLSGGAVAVDPGAAVEGALRLLSYGAAFWLAAALGRHEPTARRLLTVMATTAGGVAAYGLVVQWGGLDVVLWWPKWTYHDSLTATFVNRNAAATFLAFGCLIALTLSSRWRVVAVLCAVALLLTHSRAGVAAAGLGVVVLLGALVAVRRPSRRTLLRGALVGVVGAVWLVVVAGQGVGARLVATDLTATDRAPVHAAVIEGIAARPWLGHGLGGFQRAFAEIRPPHITQPWDKAHSSWLENAFELGLPAAVLFYAALAGVAVACLRGLRVRRRHRGYAALALAALSVAAAHAVVDFTLQMPANALWLAVLCGLGVAQSVPSGLRQGLGLPGESAAV